MSRTISASTRNRGPRASRRLYGSRGVQLGRDLATTGGRWPSARSAGASALRLQPRSMNSPASQSSSSGWEGGSLCVPKSSLVATRPVPKYACQTRLTSDPRRRRATGGRPASGRASAGSAAASGGQRVQERRARPASTASAGLRKSPRLSMLRRARLVARLQAPAATCPRATAATSASIRSLASLPLGHGRPPVAEDGGRLRGRALVARDGQDLADAARQRIGRRRRRPTVTERRNRPRLLF